MTHLIHLQAAYKHLKSILGPQVALSPPFSSFLSRGITKTKHLLKPSPSFAYSLHSSSTLPCSFYESSTSALSLDLNDHYIEPTEFEIQEMNASIITTTTSEASAHDLQAAIRKQVADSDTLRPQKPQAATMANISEQEHRSYWNSCSKNRKL
ncbi:hypothetical protein Tco_0746062 [Tanacetum coccineum]